MEIDSEENSESIEPVADDFQIPAKRLVLGTLTTDNCNLKLKDHDTLLIIFSLETVGNRKITLEVDELSKIEQSYEPGNSFLRFILRPPSAQTLSQNMPEGFVFKPLSKKPEEKQFVVELHDDTEDINFSILKNLFSSVTPIIRDPDDSQSQEAAQPDKRKHAIELGSNGEPVLEDGEPPRRTTRLRSRPLRCGPGRVLQDFAGYQNIAQSSQFEKTETEVQEKKKEKRPKRPNATLPREFDAFEDTEELFEYASLTKGMESRIVRMEDYKCLHFSELISDTILDFWLQYTFMEKLTDQMRDKVYIFPAVLYTWYSTPPTFAGWKQPENKDVPAAEKRFDRVRELIDPQIDFRNKDFVIIPCLDREHWFLVVVCYPRLNGVVSFADGTVLPQEFAVRDPSHPDQGEAVKQSCILIFDSVTDKSGRRRKAFSHVKNLLDSIFNRSTGDFTIDKTAVTCASVKCPHQSNGTDCGLFLLEFVEHFLLKAPLQDYRTPIDVENWFDPKGVQAKRAEIAGVLLKKTSEWHQSSQKPMPSLKFFDDSIIVDSDNNNDANVIDKMEEDVPGALPSKLPNSSDDVLGEVSEIEPIVSSTQNPNEVELNLPSQEEIVKNYELQQVSSTTPIPEKFLLSSQDMYDEQKDNSDANEPSEADPLSQGEKMQVEDDEIVISD